MSILGLMVAMLTAMLVPVDIYLVSSFKNENTGLYNDWASEDVRNQVETTVRDAYFGRSIYFGHSLTSPDQPLRCHSQSCICFEILAFYALIIAFVFVFIPMAYFYFEEKDEELGVTRAKRLRKAGIFTCVFVVVMGILMCIG